MKRRANERIHVQLNVGFASQMEDPPLFSCWVHKITELGFYACSARRGAYETVTLTIEWFAFLSAQSSSSKEFHSAVLSFPKFTTETICEEATMNFPLLSNVLVTALQQKAKTPDRYGTFLWSEKDGSGARVCLKEACVFSGVHSGFEGDFITFTTVCLKRIFNSSETGSVSIPFPQTKEKTFCQAILFRTKYSIKYRPTVLTSSMISSEVEEGKESIVAVWTESITGEGFRLCVRTTSLKVTVAVTWCAIGTLNPCTFAKCPNYGKCVETERGKYTCKEPPCLNEAERPVCASNGMTFDSDCKFHQYVYGHKGEKITILREGNCKGFTNQTGSISFTSVSREIDYICQTASFSSSMFNFNIRRRLKALATVYYDDDTSMIHDATAIWIEKLTKSTLNICLLASGRGNRHDLSNARASWIVFEGAPKDSCAGTIHLESWWTETTCKTIKISGFDNPPSVLATLHHSIENASYDAASVWAEYVTINSITLCVREMQYFGGLHRKISIDWIAYPRTKGISAGLGQISFKRDDFILTEENNGAFCKLVQFQKRFMTPLVFAQATRVQVEKASSNEKCNNIISWINSLSGDRFQVCIKELRNVYYDLIVIDFVILPGQKNCMNCDSNAECVRGQDNEYMCRCKSGYEGDGKTCEPKMMCKMACQANAECLQGECTCREGFYLAKERTCWPLRCKSCGENAECTEAGDDFVCSCKSGYFRVGDICKSEECKACPDMAECLLAHGKYTCICPQGYFFKEKRCLPNVCRNCQNNALCDHEARKCSCKPGFFEDEQLCKPDLCKSCSANAKCIMNDNEQYSCVCDDGYEGNGQTCTEENPCKRECQANSECKLNSGEYRCVCNEGFYLGDEKEKCLPDKCKFCGKNAACELSSDSNGMENHVCSCKMGYFRDGDICKPDHCESCPENAECALNDEEEYVCSCIEGYVGSGKTCVPAVCNQCSANAKCVKSEGVYSCECNSGFTGDGVSCTHGNCKNCPSNSKCEMNDDGEYGCVCSKGYVLGDDNVCHRVCPCTTIYNGQCQIPFQDDDGRWHYSCMAGNFGDDRWCRIKTGTLSPCKPSCDTCDD